MVFTGASLNSKRSVTSTFSRLPRTQRSQPRRPNETHILFASTLEPRCRSVKDKGNWGNTPEIVEVSDDNMVTLFTPRGYSSSSAWCVKVHCGELEISEYPQGSCPLRLKVIKRYGPDVHLGEITSGKTSFRPAVTPSFARGGTAHHATYTKPSSPETRSLYVYASRDGANSFMLEASTGETVIGDNEEISKRFMVLQIEYEAAGSGRSGSGTGDSPHRLFIC